MIDGIDKVRQDIMCILSTVKGSNIYNTSFGLDIRTIKSNSSNKTLISNEVRKALSGYPYLESIDSIIVGEITADRNLSIYVAITTVDGESTEVTA
jgi:phage baseplate assembly protein W